MNQFTKGLITLTYCHYPFSLKFHSLDDNLFKKVKSKMKKSILALSLASLVLVACSKTENKKIP